MSRFNISIEDAPHALGTEISEKQYGSQNSKWRPEKKDDRKLDSLQNRFTNRLY